MNGRAKQILIALIASRLIPRVQQMFGVTLTPSDVGDLFAAAVMLYHGAAASTCAIMNRYFPPPPSDPTQPAKPAQGDQK